MMIPEVARLETRVAVGVRDGYVYCRIVPCSTFASIATAIPHHLAQGWRAPLPTWTLANNSNGLRVENVLPFHLQASSPTSVGPETSL